MNYEITVDSVKLQTSMSSNTNRPSLLFLIGYRGSGKTSVGRALAQQLGYAFFDSDDYIEQETGKSIADIFQESGEAAFRDTETKALENLCQKTKTVVSLGGGVVIRPENRKLLLKSGGAVIWLTASAETLQKRIERDGTSATRRPNLTQVGGIQEIEHLLAKRKSWYQECATFMVSSEGLPPEIIAKAIIAMVAS